MLSLGSLSLGFAIGLVVGWNLLPQPKWVLNLWNRFKAWID